MTYHSRDSGDPPNTGDRAYDAVVYIARRIRDSPNLGYYCGRHTGVHELVCAAIAEREGKPLEEIRELVRYRGVGLPDHREVERRLEERIAELEAELEAAED